jgi:hypothetical protein
MLLSIGARFLSSGRSRTFRWQRGRKVLPNGAEVPIRGSTGAIDAAALPDSTPLLLINSRVFSPGRITLFGYVKTGIALRAFRVALGVRGSNQSPGPSPDGRIVSHRRPADLPTCHGRGRAALRRLRRHQLLPAAAAGREPCHGQGRPAGAHRRGGEIGQLARLATKVRLQARIRKARRNRRLGPPSDSAGTDAGSPIMHPQRFPPPNGGV